jgi:hypothetical protein
MKGKQILIFNPCQVVRSNSGKRVYLKNPKEIMAKNKSKKKTAKRKSKVTKRKVTKKITKRKVVKRRFVNPDTADFNFSGNYSRTSFDFNSPSEKDAWDEFLKRRLDRN